MPDNLFGDAEITDPKAMRALAHPVRLAILDRLRRHGPSTATELAPHVGATPSVVSWHLRHLASFGLVLDGEPAGDRRQRRWEAAARGFRFELPEDEDDETVSAAGELSRQMMLRAVDNTRQWLADVEPRLEHRWRRLAGVANTRIVVSEDELRSIEDEIERVLAPFVTRPVSQRPEESRSVRLLRYVLPESGERAEAQQREEEP